MRQASTTQEAAATDLDVASPATSLGETAIQRLARVHRGGFATWIASMGASTPPTLFTGAGWDAVAPSHRLVLERGAGVLVAQIESLAMNFLITSGHLSN